MSAFMQRFVFASVCFLLFWAPASSQAAAPPVVARTINIVDPELGALTFDALAAGDPAVAQQGKLVLLLHGFPTSAEEYRDVLPAIAAAGFYAVAPSQRGYSPGARPLNDSAYTLDNLARDAQAMGTALGADRFHLVGHDWGGAIAWTLAASAPWRLNTMTVLSTPHNNALGMTSDNPLGLREYFLYSRWFEMPGAANLILAAGPGLFNLVLIGYGLPADRARIYANGLSDPVALNAALAYYRTNPLPPSQTIGLITVPTLYAWGNRDFAFSANDAHDTAQYVLGPYRFEILRGANHWLVENNTDRVIELILSQVQR
ncbi:alpha/beta hydrolase [Nevskia sp.]|uniref:alpha/beta fold hydrolase n=1 Tax=Nevskia sp. TaxID=1929292 RepID=UPI0025EF7BA4|nr:alpha/beta hydrolase [Nevskia sp.]